MGTHQINAQTNYRRDFKSTKEKHYSAVLAVCSPCRHEDDKMRHILTNKNSKVNPSVVTSVLEPNSKRFSKCAIRENFNTNLTHRWKNSVQLTMEPYSPTEWWIKETYPISFTFVWKLFEHQVRDLCVSRKVQTFPSLCNPETKIRHQLGKQQIKALKGFNIIIQKRTTGVNGVEHQKTVNIEENTWKR